MNLRGAVERSLARPSSAVKAALEEPDATPTAPTPLETEVPTASVPPDSTSPITRPLTPREQVAAGRRHARQERFDRVRQMHRDGVSQRTIAKTFRLSPLTVQRYVRAEACPVWRSAAKGVPAPSPLDPFRERLERKVADGVANAKALFRDLRALGYPGGYSPVRKAVHRLTQQDRRAGPRGIPHPPVPLPPPRPPVPSARRLSFAVARRGDTRSADETRFVERLTRAEPGVKDTLALAERFANLVRTKNEPELDPWLADATASTLPEFRAFATSLRQDEAAVRAGLSLPWSNGPVEGAVNRLKVIKRSMYGRAGFDLLKARVLQSG
jgi:hypothetical protein